MHIDSAALDSTIRRLRTVRFSETRLEDALGEVAVACQRLLAVDGCGLLFLDERQGMRAVAASDGAARALERAQEELGEGPCIDALVGGTAVHSADLSIESRWPRLRERIADERIAAILGVPIHVGGGPAGTLNVYTTMPYAWDDSDIEAATAFAQLAERLVHLALAGEARHAIIEQLEYALDNRVVIERAVGFVMARDGVDAVAAFNELRARARARRERVGELASHLIENGDWPT